MHRTERNSNAAPAADNLLATILGAVGSNPDLSRLVSTIASQYLDDSGQRGLRQVLSSFGGDDVIDAEYESPAAPQRSAEIVPLDRARHRHRRISARVAEELESFALAFGACPQCWNDNPSCAYCQAEDSEYDGAPDDATFVELVAPVLPELAPETRLTLLQLLGDSFGSAAEDGGEPDDEPTYTER